MNNNEKRWIVLLVAVILIAIVVIVGAKKGGKGKQVPEGGKGTEIVNDEKYTTKLEDGTKINTSNELKSTKRYKDLEISNIQYTEKEGMTVLLADVKNVGTTKHDAEIVRIEILDENGNVITGGNQVIGEIEAGKTIKLNASITGDVVNAKDFRITQAK